MINEYGYWITIAHLRNWTREEINTLIISVFHESEISWPAFFEMTTPQWQTRFNLTSTQVKTLDSARQTLAANSFLAEDMISQGYRMIPITTSEYSATMKRNLGRVYAPPMLYVKGNTALMNTRTTTMICKTADPTFQTRADRFVAQAVGNGEVVVGNPIDPNDQYTITQALQNGGSSVIMLPHSITRFGAGFRTFYKDIVAGRVLIISATHPQSKEVDSTEQCSMTTRGMSDTVVSG